MVRKGPSRIYHTFQALNPRKLGDWYFWNSKKREKAGDQEKVVEVTLTINNKNNKNNKNSDGWLINAKTYK